MATDVDERRQRTDGQDRGRQATRPGEVAARGWLDVLKRTRRGIRDSHASIIAAGVAFYAFLALVPALLALVIVYGLIASLFMIPFNAIGGLFGIITSLVGVLIGVIFARIISEFVLIMFRINEHLGAIRQRGQM